VTSQPLAPTRAGAHLKEGPMYLFSRTVTLGGLPRASTSWAAEITTYVNDHSDKVVTLWSSTFGMPLGTLTWATWVDSLADMQASFAGLLADDGYESLLARGAEFTNAPGSDMLREVVYGELGEDVPPIGAVSTMTTATVANGKYVEGVAWGAEMAAHVQSLTGNRSFFLRDVFGTFGQVTWIAGAADAAATDAAMAVVNGDSEYLKRLGDIGDLFIPGSGRQAMSTRIA
jgi:hypothetical protein